jgi:hypothetical protein
MTVDLSLFGWHATIFLGGWLLLLGTVALGVFVTSIVRHWLAAAAA